MIQLGREKAYRGREDDLQKSVIKAIKAMFPKLIICHVPNGGYRTGREAKKFKLMGVKSGIPDILIFTPSDNYNGLAIELKVYHGRVTDNQREMMEQLEWCGWHTAVCYNMDVVIDLIKKYLK